jgi:hypothetical protein
MTEIITLAELVTPASASDVLATELSLATQLNLPVTSWQPLDPSRTLLQISASLSAATSAVIAQIAQGGYASYAALMPAGTSIYNDGAGYLTTWMDLRCVDQYNVARVEPSAASGPIPVTNSTATAQTYVAGQLHFQHPTSGATYTNTAAGTISASTTSTIEVVADAAYIGQIGTLAAGLTAIMLTPFPGVTTTAQAVALIGTAIETNFHYLARCEAKLGALSPNGADQAYLFVAASLPVFGTSIQPPSDIADYAASTVASIATAATALLAALGFTGGAAQLYSAPTQANPWGVTAAVTRVSAVLNTGSGVVQAYAANNAGGLLGCAQLAVANITWAAGVTTVTTASAHGLGAGSWVIISGVQGATGVNNAIAGTVAWQLASGSGSSFTFAQAATPGTYTSGGSVEGGDLGMVDAAIQAQVVPIGQTALVAAASNLAIPVTATVYIRTSAGITSANATTAIGTALTTYFDSVPIGGLTADGSQGVVPSSEILVTIANANSGTVSVQLSAPVIGVDTTLTSSQVPTLGTLTITVVFV